MMSEQEEENEKPIEYAYQKFIRTNGIIINDLPEELEMMILSIDGRIMESNRICIDDHCKKIREELQPYADFIMDQLYLHFGDRLNNNVLPDDEEVEMPKGATDEAIVLALIADGQKYATENELKAYGLKTALDQKYIRLSAEVGLYHESFTSRWWFFLPNLNQS